MKGCVEPSKSSPHRAVFGRRASGSGDSGFTMLELLIVVAVGLTLTVIAIPNLGTTIATYRVSGDGRAISEQLTLAKMKAGANFTRVRIVFDTSNNTYQLEKYDKAAAAYVADGALKRLSPGVAFGYGSISAPAGTQSTIAQSSPIIFNSRGIPVDGSNAPTPTNAVYFYNSTGYHAVSVALSGRIQVWKWVNSAWSAQ